MFLDCIIVIIWTSKGCAMLSRATIVTTNALSHTGELPSSTLTALKKQDSHLPQVKVDEVLRFMRNIRTKVSSDNHVPSRVIFLVKLSLNISRNVLNA
jgi:hypothetical protein